MSPRRVATVIEVSLDKEGDHRALHAAVWPDVLATLKRAGVSNHSIFLRDGALFRYLEFEGEDIDGGMGEIARDETTKAWWALTDHCQQPAASVSPGEWWAPAEEVFDLD